ncbi:MAG: hypothetical protein FWE62_00345, partial [Firmicutes bacterium]|nr:hypothetical protein [Bacillota bacterium]
MRKLLPLLIVVLTACAMLFVACADRGDNTTDTGTYSFDNAAALTCQIGDDFTLPTVKATSSEGDVYPTAASVKDPDGAAVTLTAGSFFVAKLGDYTITYTLTIDGEVVATAATKLTSQDNLPPTITVEPGYPGTVAYGAEVFMPAATAVTFAGQPVDPVYSVKDPGGNAVTNPRTSGGTFDAGDSFTAAAGGTYTITVSATSGESTKTTDVKVYARYQYELDNCDRAEGLLDWVIKRTNLTFNDDPVYVFAGTGSYKWAVTGAQAWPDVVLMNPANNAAGAYSVVFWVYNAANKAVDLTMHASSGYIAGTAYPKAWTMIEILVADLNKLGNGLVDGDAVPLTAGDLSGLHLIINQDGVAGGFDGDLYLDGFAVRPSAIALPSMTSANAGNVYTQNSAIAVDVPAVTDTAVSYTLYGPDMQIITTASDSFTAAVKGQYTLLYLLEREDGAASTYVCEFAVGEPRLENEIESFDSAYGMSKVTYWAGNGASVGQASLTTQYARSGSALALPVNSCPTTGALNITFNGLSVSDWSDYDSLIFWIYNPTPYTFTVRSGWTGDLATVYPRQSGSIGTWTMVELTLAQIQGIHVGSPVYDVSDMSDFGFYLFYSGANIDTAFTLYLDSAFLIKDYEDLSRWANTVNDSTVATGTSVTPAVPSISGVTATFKVFGPDGAFVTASGSFTANTEGVYKILYLLENVDNSLSSTYVFEVAAGPARAANEWESFDSAFGMSMAGKISDNCGSEISLSAERAISGNALKQVVESWGAKGGATVTLNLSKSNMTDLTGKYSLVFWVYNDSDFTINLHCCWSENVAVAYPGAWTMVEFTVAQIAAFNIEGSVYNTANMTKFEITAGLNASVPSGTFVTLYYDEFMILSGASDIVRIEPDNEAVVEAGSAYAVDVPAIGGHTVTYTVFGPDGAKISVSGGSFTAAAQGEYTILYLAENASGKPVSTFVCKFAAGQARAAHEWESFDSVYGASKVSFIKETWLGAAAALSTDRAISGSAYKITVNEFGMSSDQWVSISLETPITDISGYYSITYWIYNEADVALKVFVNTVNQGQLAYPNTWTMIEIPIVSQFNWLPVYPYADNVQQFNITLYPVQSIPTVGSGSGSPLFNIYIDSIFLLPTENAVQRLPATGNAATIAQDEIYTVNVPSVASHTVSYKVYNPDGAEVLVTSNQFVAAAAGTYTILYTVKDSGGNPVSTCAFQFDALGEDTGLLLFELNAGNCSIVSGYDGMLAYETSTYGPTLKFSYSGWDHV